MLERTIYCVMTTCFKRPHQYVINKGSRKQLFMATARLFAHLYTHYII